MHSSRVDELAQRIWDYHLMGHKLRKAEAILLLCSNDIRVAHYAAELIKDRWAPVMVISGGLTHEDDILATGFGVPEADHFAKIIVESGVPRRRLLLERESRNTGENITLSRRMLEKRGVPPKSLILVQKPFMERRAFATFKKFWPEPDIVVTSPPIPFLEYPNEELTKEKVIHTMVGDLQRIRLYALRGYQIPQEIPDDVWAAYEELVRMGYTKHVIK